MKYTLEVLALATMLLLVVLLVSFFAVKPPEGEEPWGGTDDEAAAIIEASGYTPWREPLWEPPSGEIETLLFTIQASAGALAIGYFFGYYRGRARE